MSIHHVDLIHVNTLLKRKINNNKKVRPIPYVPLPFNIEILHRKYFVNPVFLPYRFAEKARHRKYFLFEKTLLTHRLTKSVFL